MTVYRIAFLIYWHQSRVLDKKFNLCQKLEGEFFLPLRFLYFFISSTLINLLNMNVNIPANIYLPKVKNRSMRNKVWNMFKVNNKDTRTTSMTLLTLNIFHTFSSVSVGDFGQVNVSWEDFPWHVLVLHPFFVYDFLDFTLTKFHCWKCF